MIIDMHVHPFCKEATWDDLNKIADAMWGINPQKRKYMLKMLKNLTKNVSINDYIKLMDKFGIDKSVIVSFNVKTALDLILILLSYIRIDLLDMQGLTFLLLMP
ncbi:MAG: hypothetical protein ACTSR5_14250 [Promethearchaeota archaeon]